MKMKPASKEWTDAFDKELEGETKVERKKMFGYPAVFVNGNMAAGLHSSGLVLRFGSAWEIRFGGPEAFDEKLALAKRYLRDNPQRRLDYVDVRSVDRIVVSPQ